MTSASASTASAMSAYLRCSHSLMRSVCPAASVKASLYSPRSACRRVSSGLLSSFLRLGERQVAKDAASPVRRLSSIAAMSAAMKSAIFRQSGAGLFCAKESAARACAMAWTSPERLPICACANHSEPSGCADSSR